MSLIKSRSCLALSVVLIQLVILGGCATQRLPLATSPQLKAIDTSKSLKKVVLLPIEVTVSEISAGGMIEKVPEWTEIGHQNIEMALRRMASDQLKIELIKLADLTEGEQLVLNQHLALYQRVGPDAFLFSLSQDPAWKHKKDNFDYTLGPGLKFLRDKTGADVALILVGQDYISSSGRKALMVFGMIAAAAVGVVVVPQGAPAFVSSALVNLNDGELLWINFSGRAGSADLRKQEDAYLLISEMLASFPSNTGVALEK